MTFSFGLTVSGSEGTGITTIATAAATEAPVGGVITRAAAASILKSVRMRPAPSPTVGGPAGLRQAESSSRFPWSGIVGPMRRSTTAALIFVVKLTGLQHPTRVSQPMGWSWCRPSRFELLSPRLERRGAQWRQAAGRQVMFGGGKSSHAPEVAGGADRTGATRPVQLSRADSPLGPGATTVSGKGDHPVAVTVLELGVPSQ